MERHLDDIESDAVGPQQQLMVCDGLQETIAWNLYKQKLLLLQEFCFPSPTLCMPKLMASLAI